MSQLAKYLEVIILQHQEVSMKPHYERLERYRAALRHMNRRFRWVRIINLMNRRRLANRPKIRDVTKAILVGGLIGSGLTLLMVSMLLILNTVWR